jgi:hypothetical protein
MPRVVACLLLLALCCLFGVPQAFSAEPRVMWCGTGYDSCNQTGRGYSMCEALYQALNRIPNEEPLPLCGAPFPKGAAGFSMPQSTLVPVREHLEEIYEVEMYLTVPSGKWGSYFPREYWLQGRNLEDPRPWRPVPLEVWRKDFESRLSSGQFEPRLSYLDIEVDGLGAQRLVKYDTAPANSNSACLLSARANQFRTIGSHVFMSDRRPGAPIRRIVGASLEGEVVLYRGKPVLFVGSGPMNYWIDVSVLLSNVVTQGAQSQAGSGRVYFEQRCGIRGFHNP